MVEDGSIVGVESYGFEVSGRCPVTGYEGTLLPGLIDAHAHLVADSGVSALDRVAGYSAEAIEEVISRALRDQLVAGVTTVRDLGDRRFCVVDRRDRQLSGPVTEPTAQSASSAKSNRRRADVPWGPGDRQAYGGAGFLAVTVFRGRLGAGV